MGIIPIDKQDIYWYNSDRGLIRADNGFCLHLRLALVEGIDV